jgi:hypothetical protein
MSKVIELYSYQTTDGKVFTKGEDAERHQIDLDMAMAFEVVVGDCLIPYDKFIAFVYSNKHNIRKLFGDTPLDGEYLWIED